MYFLQPKQYIRQYDHDPVIQPENKNDWSMMFETVWIPKTWFDYLAFLRVDIPYANRMIIWTWCKYSSIRMNTNHTNPFTVPNVWFYTISTVQHICLFVWIKLDKIVEENEIWWDIYPVATSHIFIDLSRDADNTKSPAGKKATDETLWSWPSIVLKHSNVWVKSHNLIDISALHEAAKGENHNCIIYCVKQR